MKIKDWENISFFSPSENWGDWRKLDYDLIHRLDTVRSIVGFPFHVNCGSQGTHSKTSLHYLNPCRAVDGYFIGVHPLRAYISFRQTLVDLDWWELIALGFYPDWNTPGLHFDNRAVDGYKPHTWWVRIGNIKKWEERGIVVTKGYHYREDADKILKAIAEWEGIEWPF